MPSTVTMPATIEYGSETIRYEVLLVSRRTLGIEVHPDGRVLVRAPTDCPGEVIAERVRKRAPWISRQLAEFERFSPRTPARHYVSGESHLYLGRQYRLRALRGDSPDVKLERTELLVSLPDPSSSKHVRAVLQRWYRERAKVLFKEALDASLSRFEGMKRPRLIVRSMQSRWGSLSIAGTMTLNVTLVRAPRACIEYVVTHELCHLRHRDHSADFYRLLDQAMPDWEERKRRLEMALL